MPQRRGSKHPWLNDLPRIDKIIDDAIKNLKLTPDSIKNMQPYTVILKLERECHRLYNLYEKEIRERVRKGFYGSIDPRVLETSLSNARRARAGMTLEKLFMRLLNIYEIRYERNVHINKEIEFDFVFPSLQGVFKDPEHAVLLSLKREVRERWKLTVGDAYILRHKYGYPLLDNIWFLSLGEPPVEAVTAMASLCIRVYLPNGIYDKMVSLVRPKLHEDEVGRVKRFSEVIDDIIKITVTEEEKIQKCEIRKYRAGLARMKDLLDFLK